MVFLFQQEILPASSVNASLWVTLHGQDNLLVARGSALQIHAVCDDNILNVVAHLEMCASICSLSRVATPRIDLVAVAFNESLKVCICEIDIENETATPILIYDLSKLRARNTLSCFAVESRSALRVDTTSHFIAVTAGRILAAGAFDLSEDAKVDPTATMALIDYPANWTLVDMVICTAYNFNAFESCIIVVAFAEVSLSASQTRTNLACYKIDRENPSFNRIWELDIPGFCVKLAAVRRGSNLIVLSNNRISLVGLDGSVVTALKLNNLADLEGGVIVDTGLNIELNSRVQATALSQTCLLIFANHSVWMFDISLKTIKPGAKLVSEYVSTAAVSFTKRLVFIGSYSNDALLLQFGGKNGFLSVSTHCSTTRSVDQGHQPFLVCDSLSALGVISDIACFVEGAEFSQYHVRVGVKDKVQPQISGMVVCCTSGALATLTPEFAPPSLATLTDVTAVAVSSDMLMIQTSRRTVRKFRKFEDKFLEMEARLQSSGTLLCAVNGMIVYDNSIPEIRLKSAAACGSMCVALSTLGCLYQLLPVFRSRSQRRYDAVSLATAPRGTFPAKLKAPSSSHIPAIRTALDSDNVFCVCVTSRICRIVVFDTETWAQIFRSEASLCDRPRWLGEHSKATANKCSTDEVKLHRFHDGHVYNWCFAALIEEKLLVYKEKLSDFRRVDSTTLKGTRLVTFDSIDSRAGMFVSSRYSSGAVVLLERGQIHVIRTSCNVACCFKDTYGWLARGTLCFGSGFGNILLLGGKYIAEKVYLGPSVIKGHSVLVCSTATQALFVAIVETTAHSSRRPQPNPEHSSSSVVVTPLHSMKRRRRYELRIVSAHDRISHSFVLQENEIGASVCVLAMGHQSYVCLGTYQQTEGAPTEKSRQRGRLLVFQVVQQRLRLAVVRDMPGVVSCVQQLGKECLVAAVGSKLEIHRLQDAGSGTDLNLHQVAHYHSSGSCLHHLSCFKRYILYGSSLGVRLLCWRSHDKLVAEVGRGESVCDSLGVLVYKSNFALISCASTMIRVLTSPSLVQKRVTLSSSSVRSYRLSAPTAVCISHPQRGSTWAATLCCVDGMVYMCSPIDEGTFKFMSALGRGISTNTCSASPRDLRASSFDGRVLIKVLNDLDNEEQLSLRTIMQARAGANGTWYWSGNDSSYVE